MKFLTPEEASAIVGLHRRTLDRYRSSGKGPAYYKFGSRVRYTIEDIKAWAETRRVGPRTVGNRRGAVAKKP